MVIKTFTVDWESYNDLSTLANKLKSRIGEMNPNRISKREKERRLLAMCQTIWSTDTTNHYKSLNLDLTPKYYVYCHMNMTRKIWPGYKGIMSFIATLGVPCQPFYIGKGTGNRAFQYNRNGYHKKMIEQFEGIGDDIGTHIIMDNLTETEALSFEDKLIDILGLKVFGGILANLDEGYLSDKRRTLYPYNEYLKLLKNDHTPKDLVD